MPSGCQDGILACVNAMHPDAPEDPVVERYVRPVTWWQYVHNVTGGSSQVEVYKRTGISQATISRWQRSMPQPDSAAQFARAYGRPVLEAFVAAGYLSEEEASATVTVPDIGALSDDELLAEIKRRMAKEAGGEHEQRSAPMNGAGATPARKDYGLAARPGVAAHLPDTTTGEESQDHGADEPA